MPVDEQETAEAPSHPISALAEEEVIWCTSPLPEVEWSNRYMLVVTSSVGQLNLWPDGNNTRGPQAVEMCSETCECQLYSLHPVEQSVMEVSP